MRVSLCKVDEAQPFITFDLPFAPMLKDLINHDNKQYVVKSRRFNIVNKERGRNQNDEIHLVVGENLGNFDL